MKILRRTQFGNPVLRHHAKHLTKDEILSGEIQSLIRNIRYTLEKKQYGVGLAAPQVGQSVALSVIGIKPTPSRPYVAKLNLVIINPEVIKTYGRVEPMWEGCMSFGEGSTLPFAQVPRYQKIRLKYLDENAQQHEADFEALAAHVLQHETDHLNGILFVDKVEDPKTYMTIAEYKKRILGKKS